MQRLNQNSLQQDVIPLFKPLIERDELDAARMALELGWLGMGSLVASFEEQLKSFIGGDGRHVAAVSTGHAALHLGLLLAGVGPGDEVVTASFNNAADFQAILAAGAEPVLCDIDDRSLCIDLDQAERVLSPRVKAIIVMDYDCMLCDHARVAQFATAHGLRVVHDAAHSFGSRYQGKTIGSFSDLTVFSFDPIKTITCIDGGAIVMRSEEELRRVHAMRLLGMTQPMEALYANSRASTYDIEAIGFRYHMANLHAAVGLAQLAKFDTISESRRRACRYYNQHLGKISEIRVPLTDFEDITPFLYYIRVPSRRRDALRGDLQDHGIETGVHWQPAHWLTRFKNCRRGDLTTTDAVGTEIMSLPLHSNMSVETLDRVIDKVTRFFAGSGG